MSSTIYITQCFSWHRGRARKWVENKTKLRSTKHAYFHDLLHDEIIGFDFFDHTKHPLEMLEDFGIMVGSMSREEKDAYLVGIQNRDICELILKEVEDTNVKVEFIFFDRRSIKMVRGDKKGISPFLYHCFRI